jgi:glutamine cyclotransferase
VVLAQATPAATPAAVQTAPIYGYRVVAEYPHDPAAYTQGLAYVDGVLYEGTGLVGESTLRRVDLESGEVLQSVPLRRRHFGEGIAILGDRIYQLTWQNRVARVYDRETFEQVDTFRYRTEGWGLTTDGERLFMSDGSSHLVVRDPETFRVLDVVGVHDFGRPVPLLNELEYVDGEVWANVYRTNFIARIDPESGKVLGWIDLRGLLTEEDRAGRKVDVLNGIAYDPESGRLFVTGKLWPKLYEIEVVP